MAVITVRHHFRGDKTLDELSLWVIPVTLQQGDIQRVIYMLLDTGAQRSLITFDVKEMLDLDDDLGALTGVGVGGSATVEVATLDKLEIASIPFSDVEILIGQLPSTFERYKIEGLLGADILRMLVLTLNYSEKILTIERSFVSG